MSALRIWRYIRHLTWFAVTTDPAHAWECEHYRWTPRLLSRTSTGSEVTR